MALSEKDLETIQASITSAVDNSLRTLLAEDRKHTDKLIRQIVKEESCVCPMSDCQKSIIPYFFAMVGDFGGGDYSAGLLELRRNHVEVCQIRKMKHEADHTWVQDVRNNAKKYSAVAITTSIAMLVAAILGLVLATIGFKGNG